MHVKLTSASKKCALWVYLFQMNILTRHQVIPKSTVLFKTQHNTTHRPLGQSVTPVLTSFLTLAKIQVKRFKIFFPSTLLEWRKKRKNECWRAKNKKFFPRPCQTLYNCDELQVRVVCRGEKPFPFLSRLPWFRALHAFRTCSIINACDEKNTGYLWLVSCFVNTWGWTPIQGHIQNNCLQKCSLNITSVIKMKNRTCIFNITTPCQKCVAVHDLMGCHAFHFCIKRLYVV